MTRIRKAIRLSLTALVAATAVHTGSVLAQTYPSRSMTTSGAPLGQVVPSAQTDTYPSRPITLIVPFSAGGPTDLVARLLSVPMGKALGQPVVVENRTGKGGTIAAEQLTHAAPDGHTFLIHHNGMGTAPALYRKLPYDPLADFEYVSQVVDVPMSLVARKDLPEKTFDELRDHLKSHASKVRLAHAGLGAVSQLCSLLLEQALGVEMPATAYPGTGPAMMALMSGQVDLLCDQTTSTAPLVRTGTVKLYGVTSAQRLEILPDVPTLAEQGLQGFEVVVWHGIYAPKQTPREAIDKFGAALRVALKDPKVLERLTQAGAIVPPDDRLKPEGLQAWLKQETERYAPIIKAAGRFAD